MRVKISFFIIIFLGLRLIAFSQDDNYTTTERPGVGVVAGLSGFNQNMIEVGIGYQPWEVEGFYVSYPFAGFLALAEFSPDQKLYGVSLNAWYLAGFFSCGLGFNRYAWESEETYGVKPMIGISVRRIGIMYAYNFFVTDNSITALRHNSFTVKYYLPLWKKK